MIDPVAIGSHLVTGASASVWMDQIAAGLTRGGWIFLVAAGLTMVFGVLHVLNFAHGSLYLLGAYLAVALGPIFGESLIGFIGILIAAPLLVGLVGALVESTLIRPTYNRQLLYQFLLMFGVVYLFSGLTTTIWGVSNKQLPAPSVLTSPVELGPVTLPRYNLFIVLVAAVTLAILMVVLYRSSFGRDVRAVSQDPEMAALLGVRVKWVRTAVYALGAWMAGIAGVITAGQAAFGPTTGVETVILAFVVVIVGGMGSIGGALVASLIIGVAGAIGSITIPDVSLAMVYLVMAVVLLIRPWGLFGTPVKQ